MGQFLKKYRIILISMAALIFAPSLNADAIIGGIEKGTDPYVAIVSRHGIARKVMGEAPVPSGQINSVRRNNSGIGIIGGVENGIDPYMAMVSPSGVASRIKGAVPTSPGNINSVAINGFGGGIVGGFQSGMIAYVARISPSGEAFLLTGEGLPEGVSSINAVGMNDSGAGIIGGRDNGLFISYAAIVSPNGETTAIFGEGSPVGAGTISSVAINNSGLGIIGGKHQNFTNAYAAVISPTGEATEVFGVGAPMGPGMVASVAISDTGKALIGGGINNLPYAALISPSGEAVPLTNFAPVDSGEIYWVDINSSGAGILGGQDHNYKKPYAALVSPEGIVIPIKGDLPGENSQYNAVAIHESGVGILGGFDASQKDSFHAALVSPTGTATLITFQVPKEVGTIFSVDIIEELLSDLDPSSFGLGNAFADPIVALSSNVLANHLRLVPERKPESEMIGLTADAGDRIYQPACCERANYALWAAPFGLFATYEKRDAFPKLQEWSVGGILGFDYLGWDNIVFGGGAAYSYQDISYKISGGHSDIHQELLTLYVAWYGNHISIHGALWGGIYQAHNKRKTLEIITSTSNVDGGIFSPHLEIGAPFKINNTVLTIEPFVMFDWVNNWQGAIKEKGSAGLNIYMDSHYVSLLRSEIGLHLTQYLQYKHGDLTFEESASYVNRAPFNAKKEQAYYVGSASTFSVELFSDRIENLGALRFSGRYVPCNMKYPYVSLTYLGEFGANLILNTVALEIGKRF